MKKSRPWAALFAVVVLAALVVLSGCQGAVGPAGEDGAAGPAGPAGPAGDPGAPGTSDNMLPVATAIPTVYLALNGTTAAAPTGTDPATGYKARTVALDKYFKDAETPKLSYTAASSDKTIATTDANATTGAVPAAGLKITGVKAGTATITVTAFDGVNDGVSTTIDVIVVANNSPPSVSLARPIDDLIGDKKLNSAAAVGIPFTAVITPGVAGETEAITFRTVVGTGAATETKYVSADTKAGAVSGSYILTVTRLKAGLNDKSEESEITIFAQDSFGAETKVTTLMAQANATPRVKRPLPAKVYLYRTVTAENSPDVLTQTGKYPNTRFTLTDFFAVEMADPATANVVEEDDTTCTFGTNPRQPTGSIVALTAIPAVPAAGQDPAVPAYPAVATDQITNTTKAQVSNGVAVDQDTQEYRDHYPTTLSHGTGTNRARVEVNSAPTPVPASDPGATPVLLAATAAGTGTFTLTITCRDAEMSVSSSTTIEVF